MLTTEAIDRLLVEVRAFLEGAAIALAQGRSTPDLPQRARHERDVLMTALDEAPPETHEAINYLIDRLEALVARLAH